MSEYSEILEGISKTYAPRALALLSRIRDHLIAASLPVSEPFDASADDYQWSMIVFPDGDNDSKVDITIEIAEERSYDGGEGYGINFGVDITAWEGRILGGLIPYNYTPQCWVDSRDPLAVAARWRIIEDSDTETILDLIKEGS